jgi:DUF1680 family protein
MLCNNLNFFQNPRHEIPAAFDLLPLGAVLPDGWIKNQMDSQIESGFCRFLDELSPMIMQDPIWSTRRRSASRPGETNLPAGTETQWSDLQWWNGESQGNWFDGFFRTAVLTGNPEALAKTEGLVKFLISTQDADGYFGVYDPTLRLQNLEGNGELWTQAVALRALLAYFEFSQDHEILDMVEKAVGVTMAVYHEGGQNPFRGKNVGGLSHGLMFADVTEALYRFSEKTEYKDYTLWLYKAYSEASAEDNDVHFSLLSNPRANFVGHSAHTFEHLRVLLYGLYFSGFPELKRGLDLFHAKMAKVLLPSGVPFGFENLWGLHAHPETTAAEYCDMVEFEISMIRSLQLQGHGALGDLVETAFFNGMQGARLPDNKAITYDKTDNCYELTMTNPGYNPYCGHGYSAKDNRYKYSPTLEDSAVCCVPNACKSYPFYVSHMWMKSPDGLVAGLYGPCTLKTEVKGVKIEIVEKTDYPFSDTIEFEIRATEAVEFTLRLRNPEWSQATRIELSEARISEHNGFFLLTKTWKGGDRVRIFFQASVQARTAFDNSVYLQRGALVFALEIPAEEKKLRDYPIPDFHDYLYTPCNQDFRNLKIVKQGGNSGFSFVHKGHVGDNPWATPPVALHGTMKHGEGKMDVELIPMGCTILRRVTFPL